MSLDALLRVEARVDTDPRSASYRGMQDASNDGSDADLIRAAESDAAAFGVLYERHALRVHTWCHRRLEWAASDLTAETFAQAWLSRAHFRDDRGGSALPWLLGIARNVLRETVRRDRVETRARERLGLPLDLAAEDGYGVVEERLSPRHALAAAFEQLPEHERDALELRVVDELSYDQVAERLAIRPAAARLRVSRALRRLALATIEEDRS
jgi:RNA polymerase sigma-70 factor, ECF subfamily